MDNQFQNQGRPGGIYQPNPAPQQSPQPTPSMSPPPAGKSKKKLVVLILIMLALLGGAAAFYFLVLKSDEKPAAEVSQQQEQAAEEAAEEQGEKFTSKLYPDFSFMLPEGWTVSEPEKYDEADNGPGWVDGDIKVTDSKTTLTLSLRTIPITGFEGHTCYAYPDLAKVGGIYRFTNKEGALIYSEGLSSTDPEWAGVIAEKGEYTTFEDETPNFCVSAPFIGTYSSTIEQKDYPEQGYGYAKNTYALVWLSATVDGDTSDDKLKIVDKIVDNRSGSTKIEM